MRVLIVWAFLAVFGAVLLTPAQALEAAWPTRGGAGGRVIEVTSLADSGPGTLREALALTGPRRIVFKVAGEIWIESSLEVPASSPFVTVDGQTAPKPGITILGDRIRIRAHDVIFRHIRLRVGALPGSPPDNRDGFTIDGSSDGKAPNHGVLIQNCSVAWSIDEALQVWGANTHDIVIRDSIFAEALYHSIHPKGYHSMGPVIGPQTRDVLLVGNLFAHNAARNPALAGGAQAAVVNNLIYDPGFAGVHFYAHENRGPTLATVVGNVVIAGPNTKPALLAFDKGIPPGSRVYYQDNAAVGTKAFDPKETPGGDEPAASPIVDAPPFDLHRLRGIIPSGEVERHVLEHAGARPHDRDATDKRIVQEVTARSGAIRDWPADPRLDPNSDRARRAPGR